MGKQSRRKREQEDDADEVFRRLEEGLPGAYSRQSHIALLIVMWWTLVMSLLPLVFSYASFGGNKTHETKRERQSFDETNQSLSDYVFRHMFRMTKANFNRLHTLLEPALNKAFFPKGGGKRDPSKSRYLVDTKIRLGVAIRFFAGGSPYDLMQVYDILISTARIGFVS